MEESIKIYNSLKREKEVLETVTPSQVKMYVCGPTVYDEPHLWHARSAYIFDVIRRYLIYKGYKVAFVRNVTDVDDKIIEKARKEYKDENLNSAVNKVATKYLQAYHQALNKLGITSSGPDILEPKASEYIAKMVKFIEGLIDRGVAYPAGGDVYFDINKAKGYGKLSNQSLDKMEIGARVTPGENKKNPLDFALWKSAKADEPSWESPWGKGRPGWHIECSVMSSDLLGDEFDIHGGGIDLIFPHHENEIAQSEGAGKKFARIWMHHGLLTINGQKMAKSLGNFVTVDDFLVKYKNPDFLKLFFLSAQYSHPVDYTDENIEEAKRAYERILILLRKLDEAFGTTDMNKVTSGSAGARDILILKDKFIEYMDDDFNTRRALSVLFDMVNRCNVTLDSNAEFKALTLRFAMELIKEMTDILGLNFLEGRKIKNIRKDITSDAYIVKEIIEDEKGYVAGSEITEEKINAKISEREKARQEKNYKLSDKIRKELETKGIILEDTKDGKTTWRRKL
jgi:cysteinyl-tRNA synthetase